MAYSMDGTTDIKKLHYAMVNELSGYIDPQVPDYWSGFVTGLRTYMNPRQISMIRNIDGACSTLMALKTIELGNYEKLRDILNHIGQQECCEIVDKYTKNIKTCQEEDRQNQGTHICFLFLNVQ